MANPCKVLGRVNFIQSFGPGVYRVEISIPSRFTRFHPGQFLHLTLDEFDPTTGFWPESRVFSIASEPRQDHVTVVYSVKGSYTERMERELRVGRDVWVKLPYGDFIINEDLLEQGPVVLIAGGTGVSPYIPFLSREAGRSNRVHLFYGVRQPDHLLFGEVMSSLSDQPWFQLHLFSEEVPEGDQRFHKGRLSIEKVFHEIQNPMAAHYFISGPPAMIGKFRTDLAQSGVTPEQIHIDEWE